MEKRRLKILLFVETFFPVVGGISTVVDRSCIALSNFADVTLVAVNHHTDYVDPPRPYRIIRCKGFYNGLTHDGIAFANSDKVLNNEIINGKYDVFHCHTAGPLFDFARKMAIKLNIPLIFTVHNTVYAEVKRYAKFKGLTLAITKMFTKKSNKADYVWAVSNYCKNYVKQFGATKEMSVVDNAIDFTDNNTISEFSELEKTLDINPDTKLFTFVSRVEKNKNIDLILNSVDFLYKNYNNKLNHSKFAIVGDGTYLKKVKRKVEKLGLLDYFIFTGMIKDRNILSCIYARSSLVLFPSIIESCGLIQIEAAAFGVPTATVENSAPSEKIIDKINGFVSKNTKEDYASKILFALEHPQKLKKIGDEAKNTLYRSYSDVNVMEGLYQKYLDVVKDFRNKQVKKDEK